MPQIQKTIGEFTGDGRFPTAGIDESVVVALKIMEELPAECVLVLDGQELAGIFTGRDFINRVAAVGRDATTTKLRDVMTADPDTLAPDDCITYAINRMAVRGFRNIPIVDAAAKPVALMSVRDVVTHLSEVFAELGPNTSDREWDEWTDTGGG